MAYYKSLREYIEALDKNALLWRIKSTVKKETELMPVVRWQYRGLGEEQRRAFLFENVTDVKGRRYDIPVLVGALASSADMYALGLMCKPEEIGDKWSQALVKPIPPKLVKEGAPIKDSLKANVFSGEIISLFTLPEYCLVCFKMNGSPKEYDFEIKFPRYFRERHNLFQGKKIEVAIWEPNIILFLNS